MTPMIYFDDVEPGSHILVPSYTIEHDEMLAFATKWDPLPIHTDATAAGPGGITAPGIYMLAIKMALIHRMPVFPAVIASFGYEEVKFLAPAHAGDVLTLDFEWLDKRPSGSRPDRGIVRHRSTLITQANQPVMTMVDTLLMHRRPADAG